MADVTPIRVVVDGSGDTTGLSEFLSGETLGLVHGGTGAATASAARTNLGLHVIAVSGSWTDLLNKPTTDGITEGTTNLYYTDARVLSYLGTNSYVTQTYVDTAISNMLDGAPGVLDTLNELAAAIGDDANFATTINTSITNVQSNVDALFGTKTTTDLAEGTNLYFTDARVDSRITSALIDEDDMASDSETKLPSQQSVKAYVASQILTKDNTDEIAEGSTNLYFTNERVDDRVGSLIVGGTNIDAVYSDINNRLTLNLDSTGGFSLTNNSTSDLQEGSNLYFTNARADARVAAGIVSGGVATQTFVMSVVNPVSASLNAEIAATNTDITTLTTSITGEISRATSKENSIQSDLDDEIFDRESAIASLTIGDMTDVDLTTVPTNNQSLVWDNANSKFIAGDSFSQADFNTAFTAKSTTDLSEGTNLYYTDARADARVGSATGTNLSLANKTTDDLSEGSTNLYHTNARARLSISGTGSLSYNSSTGVMSFTQGNTDTISEGSSNLYYTDARVRSHITGSTLDMGSNDVQTTGKMLYSNMYSAEGNLPSATTYHGMFAHVHGTGKAYFSHDGAWKKLLDESSSTTTDLSEGSNLYYTDARARAAISGTGSLSYNSSTGVMSFTQGNTDTVSEGSTNLYYTDARVATHLSNNGIATNTYVDTAITNLIDSSPAALDTLNELAAALGDDAAFSTTVTNSIATKLAITDFTSTANTWIGTKTTTDLSEGTNLYYTDAKVDARITNAGLVENIGDLGDVDLTTAPTNNQSLIWDNANSKFIAGDSFNQSQFNTSFTAKSTDDLSEGSTNLYLTTARVTTIVNAAMASSTLASDLDDEIFDRETADADLQTQISAISTYSAFDADFASKSTTDLSEGTNLYHTQARFDTAFTAKSTANLTENTNLYYTQARFDTAFTAKTTANLSENTNLYYTDARVQTKLGDVSGHIIPDTNITYDLGSTTHRFRDLFLSGTSISLGDATISSEAGGAMVLPTGSKMATTPTSTTNSTIIATTAFVNTAVAALVDTAPATLDTLNELAASINDDANYAATVTTALSLKFNISDYNSSFDTQFAGKSTTDLSEGTNFYYTAARDTAQFNTDFATKTTANLTENTNLYYTDARVRTHLIGQDLDLGVNNFITTGKMLYANMYATTGDLPSATTYHGMFAHVHGTGKGYFSHSGAWKVLLDESSSTTTNLSEGTNLYYTQARFDTAFTAKSTTDLGEGTNLYYTQARFDTAFTAKTTDDLGEGSTNLYYTDARVDARITASGSYSNASVDSHINVSGATSNQVLSWNGTDYTWVAQSGGVSAIDGLSDVDISTTAPTDGQTLVWNASGSKFLPGTISGGGGVATSVSDTAPASPSDNDLWLNSTNLKLFVYYNDGSSAQWVEAAGGSNTSSNLSDLVNVHTTTPTDGQVLTWDNTNSYWKPATASGGGGGGGSSVTVADTAPTSPTDGDMWFNSLDTKLYIRYNDGSSAQWVQSHVDSAGTAAANTWVEKSTAYTVVAGEKLFVDCSSGAVTVTLPSSATLGDEIRIVDATGNSSTNNITIARNGHKIQGGATDLTIDTDRAAFGLAYYNVAQGWLITEK